VSRQSILSVLLFVAVPCSGAPAQQSKPAALGAAERARSQATLRTGHVEWSVTSRRGDSEEYTRFFGAQFAGEDFTMVCRGDEDGVVARNPDGTPATGYGRGQGPIRQLVKAGQVWTNAFGIEVRAAQQQTPWGNIYDVRLLGLYPWVGSEDFYGRLKRQAPAGVEWTAEERDGLHVVSAKLDKGELRWWIDPAKGWNPVRVAVLDANGDAVAETRTTLRQYGNTWFPELVARYARAYQNGQIPYQEFQIHGASFNAPDDPQTLTPEDIGVEVGMGIHFYGQPDDKSLRYWDGEKPIPFEELLARMRSGELHYGPTMARERGQVPVAASPEPPGRDSVADARRQHKGAELSSTEPIVGEWEKYTRWFIDKYRLNEEQKQKAWQILKSCQQNANAYLAKHSDKVADLDRRTEALKGAPAERRQKEAAALAKERAELKKPLDDIFERQLKPRLDRLPTREQRRQAETSSQPSQGTTTSRPAVSEKP
jgi:hypothetical protein